MNLSFNKLKDPFDGDIEELGDEIGDENIGHCVNKKIPFTMDYH